MTDIADRIFVYEEASSYFRWYFQENKFLGEPISRQRCLNFEREEGNFEMEAEFDEDGWGRHRAGDEEVSRFQFPAAFNI